MGFNIYWFKSNEAVKKMMLLIFPYTSALFHIKKQCRFGYLDKNQIIRMNNFNTPLPLNFPALYYLLREKM